MIWQFATTAFTRVMKLLLFAMALLPRIGAGQSSNDDYKASASSMILAVAILADGSAVIGGSFTEVNSQPCAYVCRLNADGTPDPTFNPNANANVFALAAFAYVGDGKSIFDNLCHACHETAAGGTPMLLDKAHSGSRLTGGIGTLVKHAIEGFTGTAGMMPTTGGNHVLSDEQVKAAVDWMIT